MTLWQRITGRHKTAEITPRGPSFFNVGPPVAGVQVTEEVALTYSAVWACVKIISESMACLPWHVVDAGARYNRVTAHPLRYILDVQTNPQVDAASYRESAARDCALGGNHYGEIERDRSGNPLAVWRVPYSLVTPRGDHYQVKTNNVEIEIDARDMLHIKGPTNDGLVGLSAIGYAREAISMGLAVERFGAAFFGNGAQMGGIIKNPAGGMTEDGIKNMLSAFESRHKGTRNAHRVGYLDGGMDYVQTSIPPEDAQFLQSRKFNILEICRIFRVPPHKLAELERSTNNNIEAQNIEFVSDCVLPWVIRFESAVRSKLIGADEAIDTKLAIEGLLRADSAARGSFHTAMFNIGAKSINEIREHEDLAPIPQGDRHYVGMNLQAVEDVGRTPAKAAAVAQVAGTYERAAVNGLKRVATAEGLAAWTAEQPANFVRLFTPVMLAGYGNADGLTDHAARLMAWYSERLAECAALPTEQAAETLRGRVSEFINELFRG
jgi:HK97 family phage portal protein